MQSRRCTNVILKLCSYCRKSIQALSWRCAGVTCSGGVQVLSWMCRSEVIDVCRCYGCVEVKLWRCAGVSYHGCVGVKSWRCAGVMDM